MWDLVFSGILWLARKRLKQDGQLFALCLGLYAVGKFALTFSRYRLMNEENKYGLDS